MDGFEFPPGSVLKVMFAEPLGMKGGPSHPAPADSGSLSAVTEMRESFAQMMTPYPNMPPAMPAMGYPPALQAPMSPSGSDKVFRIHYWITLTKF